MCSAGLITVSSDEEYARVDLQYFRRCQFDIVLLGTDALAHRDV